MVNEYHEPVLSGEVVRYLCTESDGIYVDCTLGGGGHTAQILQHGSLQSKVIGIDRDTDALRVAHERLIGYADRIKLVQGNFADVRQLLEELGIDQVQGFLLDLGVSSHQINEVSRGFSFQGNSRIDMRMSKDQAFDGWAVVNEYEESQLSDIFWRYGEERFSRKIARRIVEQREHHSINTTEQLGRVVESVVGQRMLVKSLARIFQAIRIEVNNELENLEQMLGDAVDLLVSGGRIVVISYHSLEDRIVKHFFKEQSQPILSETQFVQQEIIREPLLRILTKKPVEATEEEIRHNSRARSAKLRAVERI